MIKILEIIRVELIFPYLQIHRRQNIHVQYWFEICFSLIGEDRFDQDPEIIVCPFILKLFNLFICLFILPCCLTQVLSDKLWIECCHTEQEVSDQIQTGEIFWCHVVLFL